jgi:hypothetical protein
VVVLEAGQALMVASAEVFATFATWGFQSFLVRADVVDGGAASVGLAAADGTIAGNWSPSVAAAGRTGAEDTATAVALLVEHMAYSTSAGASDWLAVRRWVVHAGRAGETAQTLASLIVACGKIWEGNSPCSWSRRPSALGFLFGVS